MWTPQLACNMENGTFADTESTPWNAGPRNSVVLSVRISRDITCAVLAIIETSFVPFDAPPFDPQGFSFLVK